MRLTVVKKIASETETMLEINYANIFVDLKVRVCEQVA